MCKMCDIILNDTLNIDTNSTKHILTYFNKIYLKKKLIQK